MSTFHSSGMWVDNQEPLYAGAWGFGGLIIGEVVFGGNTLSNGLKQKVNQISFMDRESRRE